MKLSPHDSGVGVICVAEGQESMLGVAAAESKALLAEHGFVLFRGFGGDVDVFGEWVRSCSSRVSLDPARRFKGGTAQKVDAGVDAIGLHCENGNSPFWPDLCWFYCERAPMAGSQTTICDGVQVLEQMDPEARGVFERQPILYSRRVGEQLWRTYVFHALSADWPELTGIEDVTFDDLKSLAAGAQGTEFLLEVDGTATYRFTVPAIRYSVVAQQPTRAFANSIFGPSFNYEPPRITMADGSDIQPAVLQRSDTLCQRLTFDIGWRDGDVALIDNTRVMHGRRKIVDEARTIYNALSYL
jgi:hypothetical protein